MLQKLFSIYKPCLKSIHKTNPYTDTKRRSPEDDQTLLEAKAHFKTLYVNPVPSQSTKPTAAQTQKKKCMYTQTSASNFQEFVPSVLPLLKEHVRLGHAGMLDHSVWLIDTRLKKKYDKRMDRKKKVMQMHNGKHQCHMAADGTYNYHPIAAQQEPYKKA